MDHANRQGGAPPTWLDWLGLPAAIAVVVGPLLGWLRLAPALAAFYLFALGGIVSVVCGLSALIQAARGRGFGFGRAAALVGGMVFVVSAAAGGGGPVINDFTTDVADPPTFEHATALPANAGRAMSYDPSFAAEQRACCPDLQPLELSLPFGEAFKLALKAARSMPRWRVVWTDPPSGRIEAVATTPIFGFHDDVAIRVRPQSSGSRIDVRSKSRDGRGDLGANAERIRAYLERVRSTR